MDDQTTEPARCREVYCWKRMADSHALRITVGKDCNETVDEITTGVQINLNRVCLVRGQIAGMEWGNMLTVSL